MDDAKQLVHNTETRIEPQAEQKIVAGYRLVKPIGHGSQGYVYLGESLADGTRVAVKKLNIESVKNWKSYDLFRREAEVLSSLDIKGVAKFYTAVEYLEDDPPCSYIVQEYIEGRSLAEFIQSGARYSLTRVYEFVLQMLDILEQLHKHDPVIIHRDIKPSNILISRQNCRDYYYLIDFGAVANPQVQGGGSTVAGTYGYMPPEQLMGKPCPASDIYSLAAVVVHLITGISPADMQQKDFRLMFEPYMQNMVPEVVSTLREMLDPDVEKRLCDIDKIRTIFNDFYHQKYHHHTDHYQEMSADEYIKKLDEYSEFGQPGSIDLWEYLSNEPPRKTPKNYWQFMLHLSRVSRTKVFMHAEKDGDVYGINKHASRQDKNKLYDGVGFLFVILGIISLYFLVFLGSFTGNVGMVWVGLSVSLIPMVMIILAILVIKQFNHEKIPRHLRKKRSRKDGDSASVLDFYDIEKIQSVSNDEASARDLGIDVEVDGKRLADILTNGRKTIATIVSVEYIPVSTNMVERAFRLVNVYGDVIEKNEGCRFVVNDVPTFKVCYKFNPPDDDKDTDLIHEIYIHSSPDRLKVGDPLPIIYVLKHRGENLPAKAVFDEFGRIQLKKHQMHDSDEGKLDYVTSMPYPIPLDSMMSLRELCCSTLSGKMTT